MLKKSSALAAVISQSRLELEGHSPEVAFQILRKRFRNLHVEISDEELERIASDIARSDGSGPEHGVATHAPPAS